MHSISYKFQRSVVNTLQAKHYCLTPIAYKTGSPLRLTRGAECYAPWKSSFIMPNLDLGGVNVEIYDKLASRSLNGLQTDPRYIAKTPTWSGVISNFYLYFFRHADGWGARMTTYFTAFQTGPHRFNLAANDMASLRILENPGNVIIAKEIISLTRATRRNQYRRYIAMQYSEPTHLQSGHTYYLEVLVVNDDKDLSASVRVQLPDLTYKDLAGKMLSKNYA